jgi:hypothetical protein
VAPQTTAGDKPKTAKTAANATFGTNMPMMCSAFDTAMWQNAA